MHLYVFYACLIFSSYMLYYWHENKGCLQWKQTHGRKIPPSVVGTRAGSVPVHHGGGRGMSTGTDPIAEAPSEGLSPHFLRHTPAFPGHEAHRIRKGDGERRFAGACGRPQLSPRPNPLTLTPQRQYLYAAKVLPLCRKGTTVTLERYYLLGGKVLPF